MSALKINFEPDSTKGLFVEFFRRKLLNKKLADETGEVQMSEKVYIRTKIAGAKYDIPERIARLPEDAKKFPEAWAAFQSGAEGGRYGTPLTDIEGFDGAIIAKLAQSHIYNAESLAALSDAGQNTLGTSGRVWIRMAKDHLAKKDAERRAPEMMDELRKRDEEVAQLQEQVAALIAAQAKGSDRKGKTNEAV